jgi:hypothetical protein
MLEQFLWSLSERKGYFQFVLFVILDLCFRWNFMTLCHTTSLCLKVLWLLCVYHHGSVATVSGNAHLTSPLQWDDHDDMNYRYWLP